MQLWTSSSTAIHWLKTRKAIRHDKRNMENSNFFLSLVGSDIACDETEIWTNTTQKIVQVQCEVPSPYIHLHISQVIGIRLQLQEIVLLWVKGEKRNGHIKYGSLGPDNDWVQFTEYEEIYAELYSPLIYSMHNNNPKYVCFQVSCWHNALRFHDIACYPAARGQRVERTTL